MSGEREIGCVGGVTIEFDAIETGTKTKHGSVKYNPDSKTLELRTLDGRTVDRVLLHRRFGKFTDETRKQLGF